MQMTKKLEKLLAKYKKANRARLTAYNRRSRLLSEVIRVDGTKQLKREPGVHASEELRAKLNADIEVARLRKLKVSAELRAYCKKKKYHIQWGNSNQICGVLSHLEWQLRRQRHVHHADTLLVVMYQLNLTQTAFHCYY